MHTSPRTCLVAASLLAVELAAAQTAPPRRPGDVRSGVQAVEKSPPSTTASGTCGSGDDQVVCSFQSGDMRAPVVTGPLYKGSDRPPTSQNPTDARAAPANAVRTGLVDGHPAIAWQPAPGVTGYEVLRTTVKPAGWVIVRSAASAPAQFVDLSVAAAAAASYIYRLIAHCPAGPPVYVDVRFGAPQVSMPVCR